DFLLKMQTELRVQEEQLAEAEHVMKEMAVGLQEGRLPSLEELKATIAECEAAINALGPINLRALEDYDAQQARSVELKDPFYRLEKINLNVDAINAEKVGRMIRRNSSTAQFVQISLRKVSLKEADHLVGVTMTPESVSEVIMRVNLADIEDEKPTEVIPA